MVKKRKIVFVQSHPIHWFSPQFKYIAEQSEFDFEVLYCSEYGLNKEPDHEFGKHIDFKVDLLDGYKYIFLKNISFYRKNENKLLSNINFQIFKHFKKNPKGTIYICHGWSRLTYLFVFLFAPFYGMKTGLRSESPISHERKYTELIRFLRKILFKYILFRRINFFVFIGSQNKWFYKYYGVKDSKLFFLPYCVDNNFFSTSYKRLLKNGVDRNKKLYKQILFVGKLIPKKNPESLIKVFLSLNNDNHKLVLVGDGSLKKTLEIRYKKYIKNNRIAFLGFKDQFQLCKIYANSDLFVLPSGYGETWGLVCNEACNFELPLLLSNRVGSSTDLVNGNGLIFDYSNNEDFERKLSLILEKNFTYNKNPTNVFNFSTIVKSLNSLSLS